MKRGFLVVLAMVLMLCGGVQAQAADMNMFELAVAAPHIKGVPEDDLSTLTSRVEGYNLGPVTTETQAGGELTFSISATAEGTIKLAKLSGNLSNTVKLTISATSKSELYVCGYVQIIHRARYIRYKILKDGKPTGAYHDEPQPIIKGDLLITPVGNPYLCAKDQKPPKLY